MESNFIECEEHGENKMAFVCHHFLEKQNIGWNEKEEYIFDEDDEFWDCISAWCDECENYRIENDGWDEDSEKFADITLVCESCALKFKEENLK